MTVAIRATNLEELHRGLTGPDGVSLEVFGRKCWW